MKSAFVALAMVAAVALQTGASPKALTAQDIVDAIRLGNSGGPQPYPMHHMPGQRGIVVAVVYTPFIRVALAAKGARLSGQPFEITDVSPQLIEPTVYVAFRWYCCDERGNDPVTFDPFTVSDYKIAVPGDSVARNRAYRDFRSPAQPLWIEQGTTRLAMFGELPYPDLVLVAGYPKDAFADHDFIIYRDQIGRQRRSLRVGRALPEELAIWR